jgi:putative transposase
MLHREFAQTLNIVIMTKMNLHTGAFANINLFSRDPDLPYQKVIAYYSLRFQIEYFFRALKQYRGIEEWMNIKELSLINVLNLLLFRSTFLRYSWANSDKPVLKAYFLAAKHFEEIIKASAEPRTLFI